MNVSTAAFLFTDSESLLDVLENKKIKHRTKHMGTRVAYLRDLLERRVIRFFKIDTRENVTDFFTKGFGRLRLTSIFSSFLTFG